jgi:glycosyltransferase involved in cell wall biosynthesis
LKIAHLINGLSLGGSEQVGVDLAIAQRKAGHASHVVALRDPPGDGHEFSLFMKRRLLEVGTPFTEFHARAFRLELLRLPLQLAGLIRREGFDIVHAHGEPGEFVAAMARRLVRFRMARTIHNVVLWPTYRRLGRITERGFNDDLVIAVTDDAMEAYERQRRDFGLKLTPFRETINNGIPIPPEETRNMPLDGVLRMAFFGRAVPQKGLDILLDALGRLPGDAPPVRLTIYSDAADMPEWRSRISGLGHAVTLEPPTPDARSLMKDFDVVAMPSRHEGMGLVAIEAFAAGTCVIAADAPGLRGILPPGWPLVVPAEDSKALAEMIAAVARGRWDLGSLGRSARGHAARYSIEEASARYVDAYRRYLCADTQPAPEEKQR